MPESRSSPMVRLCVALFDYALVVILAGIASLWWWVASLALDPDPARLFDHGEGLVVGWTALAVLVFWRAASRRTDAVARRWRVLGSAVVVALGVICLWWVRATAMIHSTDSSGAEARGMGGVFLLCLVALVVLRGVALKRAWLSGVTRTALAAGAAGYLVYLAWDEPAAPSVARNHAAMAGRNEDEATYLLTLRYSKAPGAGKAFVPPTHKLTLNQRGEKEEWHDYLLAHRAEIESNWAELAEVRAWWAEMAAHPQLGDRQIESFDQSIMSFRPIRTHAQHALAIAGLQAIDGDGDGALATVAEVYVVGARLGRSSFTLVRSMVAHVVRKQSIETGEFVLDQARVSSEARARFASLLEATKGGPAGAKRFVLAESGYWTPEMIAKLGPSEPVTRLIAPLTLNRQATVNRLHDWHERLARSAEARDLDAMRAVNDEMSADLLGGLQVKNLAGRMLVHMAIPAYTTVVSAYWETEDRRMRLIERLGEAPPSVR